MLDSNSIYFPQPEAVPQFAMEFMRMMFAHAEFEEQVRELRAVIMVTPAKRPHVVARLLRLLNFGRKTDGGLGTSRRSGGKANSAHKEGPRPVMGPDPLQH
jgi:hypothetical protein